MKIIGYIVAAGLGFLLFLYVYGGYLKRQPVHVTPQDVYEQCVKDAKRSASDYDERMMIKTWCAKLPGAPLD